MKPIRLFSDNPFDLKEDPDQFDKLGFCNYSKVLARTAIGAEAPLTIGIYGGWGTGKTTLMRMIQSNLNKNKETNVLTVWFNAWQYEKEVHPIIPLCATLIEEIRSSDMLKDIGDSFIKALRSIAYGFKAKTETGNPLFGKIGLEFSAKDIIDRYGELRDPLLEQSLYYKAFKMLDETSDKIKDVKIIVFIDDLDRCTAEKAVELLESIKLVLSLKGFVFVLGLAPKVISSFLKSKYKEEYKIEGQDYLDKIIQVPFYLPDHSQSMESFAKEMIEEKYKEDEEIKDLLEVIGALAKNNPRSIKMLINTAFIFREIAREKTGLKDISPGFFGITWALQNNWHVMARAVQRNHLDFCEEIATLSNEEHQFRSEIIEMKKKIVNELGNQLGKEHPNYSVLQELENEHLLIRFFTTKIGRSYLAETEKRKACWTLSGEFSMEVSQIAKTKKFEPAPVIDELDQQKREKTEISDLKPSPPSIDMES